MSHPFASLVDQIVTKAASEGAFEDLSCAGQPLTELDAPDATMVNRAMKEANTKPPLVLLKEQVAAEQQKLKPITDPAARKTQMRVIADLELRLSLELEAMQRFG